MGDPEEAGGGVTRPLGVSRTVELQDLGLIRGKRHVLRDVSMVLPDRGLIGLVGENGSGKTSLLEVLAGHARENEGRIVADGHPLSLRSRRRVFGRLSQDVRVPRGLTVAELLGLAVGCSVSLKRDTRVDSMEWASAVETGVLSAAGVKANARISDLSWGQARLVQVLAILLGRRRDLLMDEPLAGLTAAVSTPLVEFMRRRAEAGLVLWVEHDLRLMQGHANMTMVIRDGSFVGSFRADESEFVNHVSSAMSQRGRLP